MVDQSSITAEMSEARNIPEQEVEFTTVAADVETIFVDGMKDVVVHNGVARLSFFQVRMDSLTGGICGVHVVGLALSSSALKAFSSQLATMIADMESKNAL
jgi:hypothetical protein